MVDGTAAAREILVLEDDAVQVKLYTAVLERGGFKVRSHGNPKELLGELGGHKPPSLILSDINMPGGIDGLGFMQQILSDHHWCRIPVVMMTANPSRERIAFGQHLPIPPEGFVVKPIEPLALIQIVKAVLKRENPTYLLRSLQRDRLGTILSLQYEQASMDRSMVGAVKAIEECTEQLSVARKELQVVRRTASLLGKESEEVRAASEAQLEMLERDIKSFKTQTDAFESERRELISRRHETLLSHQSQIKALDERIRAVSAVVRMQSAGSKRDAA